MADAPKDHDVVADGGTEEPSDRELQISKLLAEYFQREDAGQTISREEFLKEHAEFANDLDLLLQMGDIVQELAGPVAADSKETADGDFELPNSKKEIEGFQLGDYSLLEVLGEGAMGIVYRAHQNAMNRDVAIKMIRSGQFAFNREITRFYTEAQAAGAADHPNVITVYELGEHDGHHFYAMQLIEGDNLALHYRNRELSYQRIAEILRDVSLGVHAAHQHDVLHRDLKPSNIIIRESDGVAIVMDFGLAKQMTNNSGATKTGDTVGTPSYMSPEQARADETAMGPTTDVYSIGAILYELITGRPPFRSQSSAATVVQLLHQDVVPPSSVIKNVNPDLEAICCKCLEKNPMRRYASANDLADEFERVVDEEPVLAQRPTRRKKVVRWLRNMPVVGKLCGNPFPQPTRTHAAAIGAMCVLLLLAAALFVVLQARMQSHIPIKPLLGTGVPNHFYDQVGRGLTQRLRNYHGVAAHPRSSNGSEENIQLLLVDSIQAGIAQREVISSSEGVSIVAPLYVDKIHIVIRRGAHIHSLKDLEDSRVSLGTVGSGMRITSKRLLQVLNLNINLLENNGLHFEALLTEDLLDAAIVTTRTENSVLQDILADERFDLLKVSPQEIAKLTQIGYHRDQIQLPNGESVETVGTMAFLICRENASSAWVEMLLLGLYDRDDGESVATRLNLLPRHLAAQYPIKFHSAAKKYFQQIGSP